LPEETQKRKAFSLSWLPRGRWNILDLIEMGRVSVPTYMLCDIDMTWAEGLRAKLANLGQRVTITAILLKAIAIAQRHHPATRTALLPWGGVVTFNEIVAGFTVERHVDCGPAVFLGTIHQADTKSIEEIASELQDYGQKPIDQVPQLAIENRFAGMPWLLRKLILWVGTRIPQIRLRYLSATFGLSSLGKYGVKTLIPPSVCTSIFGVGSVDDRPVVRDGKIEIRPMLSLTYNFDHRLIDGAPAARFVDEIRNLLEGGLSGYLIDELGTTGSIGSSGPIGLPTGP